MHLSVYPAHKATTTGGQLLCCTPLSPSGCMCSIGCIHARPARQAAFLCTKERGREGKGEGREGILLPHSPKAKVSKGGRELAFIHGGGFTKGTPRFLPTTNKKYELIGDSPSFWKETWKTLPVVQIAIAGSVRGPNKKPFDWKKVPIGHGRERERDTHTRISISRKNTPFPYFWFEGEYCSEIRFFLQA